ncbi:MAG TPA: BRO family protein [Gemmataceae bacterium]
MSSIIPSGRSPGQGRSPFDEIRHVDEDEHGEFEWWSAREAMPYLGYKNWQNMENVIAKAKAACRNSGHQVRDNFRDTSKVSAQRGPWQQDVQMSRFGMYLLAMNGDPDKPEIAAAQRYFTIQTFRAEMQLPQPREEAPLLPRHWSERLDRTIVAHRRYIIQNHPAGCWSIYTATVTETLILEDEFLRHCLPLKRSDLPDGSIGKRWVNWLCCKSPDSGTLAKAGNYPALSSCLFEEFCNKAGLTTERAPSGLDVCAKLRW